MLNKSAVFPVAFVAMLMVGAVPLIVVIILTATLIQALIGGVLLVIVAVVAAFWLSQQISRPLAELSQIAVQVQAAVDAEMIDSLPPLLSRLDQFHHVDAIGQIATAFEETVTVLHERMTEFNSIYAIGQTLTAKLDFEQTVEAVVSAVEQVVSFDAAEVSVLRGQNLVVEAWLGQEDFNNTTGREYHVGRGPTGMIATNKASVLVSTISETEDLHRTLGYESAAGEFLTKTTKVVINSFLGIPLLVNERLIGALTLVHRAPGHFTEDDMRRLNKLADQASIAIDNAIQIRQRENALKARIRELRIEIDQAQLDEQVDRITTTDYFQNLQAQAARARQRVHTRVTRRGQTDRSAENAHPDDPGSTPAG
jgi:GAF domain-containing protein